MKNAQLLGMTISFVLVLIFPLHSCKEDVDIVDPDKVIISPNVIVVDSKTWDQFLIKLDSIELTAVFAEGFDKAVKKKPGSIRGSEEVTEIKKGDIIVTDAGSGFAARVSAVQKNRTQLVYNMQKVVLTDIIEQGLIEYSQPLTPLQIASVQNASPGIVLQPAETKGSSQMQFTWTIDESFQNDQVNLVGSFGCNLTPVASIKIKLLQGLQEVRFGVKFSEQLQFGLTASAPVTGESEATKLSYNFDPVYIIIGGVPITFKPILHLKVGLDGTSSSGFSSGFNQSLSYEAGLHWYDGSWTSYKDLNSNQNFNPPLNRTNVNDVRAYVKPELEIRIMGFTGLYSFAKVYGKLKAYEDPVISPWWTIYKGFCLGAGVRIDVLSWHFEHSEDNIFNYDVEVAHEGGPGSGHVQPTITIDSIQVVDESHVQCGWQINNQGTYTVMERGICWSNQMNPTIIDPSDYKLSEGTGTGIFSSEMSSLQPNTTYYVRSFAINSLTAGPKYSNNMQFHTPSGSFTDSRDQKKYVFQTIGTQIWMAENLAYLPNVFPVNESSDNPRYYVNYFNGFVAANAKATSEYQKYGALYNWPAANTACPAGWHLPSDAEWKTLESFLGMDLSELDQSGWRGAYTGVGQSLKSRHGWNSNGNGYDDSHFSAYPGGWLREEQSGYVGEEASFWTSSQSSLGSGYLINRSLSSVKGEINRQPEMLTTGLSVRCIKD